VLRKQGVRHLALLLGLAASLAACDDRRGFYGGTSEIVFGLEQSSTGVAAGYELLGLANQGGSFATAFRDGDGRGRCWFERLDTRLGRPHVESGIATWTGGLLPAEGFTVLANQPGLTRRQDKAWDSTDTLSL